MLLQRLLGSVAKTSFVGIRTQLADPWNIHLAARAVVNHDCHLDGRGGDLTIGEDADIGPYTHIWTLEHEPSDPQHGTKHAPVTIEHHAWIASRVTILPGVTIGAGAVVAAGAVVTRDVAPKAIVAGIPAEPIGERTNDLDYQLSFNPRWR
ncbi:MAG: acyltransferase [Planctomycetota bacterium]